ncbi:MAG: phosphoglucosamine mutase, partial [Desulfobacterales bacterium]|nr:phosphoglucosamine mutase [Desulfobacterales bacterium]
MPKLFGTDGIRGEANQPPMTGQTALAVGRSVAGYFGSHHGCDRIIVGKDTRISGDMLEYAIAAGVCAAGIDVLLAGVVPTPAVAYLVRQNKNAAGIVISASHNPWHDNGIKVFGHEGRKLSEAVEGEIESLLSRSAEQTGRAGERHIGRVRPMPEAFDAYTDFLCSSVPAGLLKGLSVVIDCAHGAAFAVAPQVFERLGADLTVRNAAPDGRNINADCGSEHPDGLIQAVKAGRADIGLAFDGDADRLIAVDENGQVVAGDQLIALCAAHYKEQHRLENNCVVTTVMSNIGLKRALEKLDITHAVSGVGDRYVMEKMIETGAVIGGENSGHLIFRDRHTTGDGILSALKILEVMQTRSAPLSELARIMEVFPQELVAVNVTDKPALETLP